MVNARHQQRRCMPTIERIIVISSEDDRLRVAGGIGTYLGLWTKMVREVRPELEVHWIARAPEGMRLECVDAFGVHRVYLPIDPSLGEEAAFAQFRTQVNDTVGALVRVAPDLPTVIEVGDWEGHGADLFRFVDRSNILRVARLHTPLATCVRQNRMRSTAQVVAQLRAERQTLLHADLLSSCTQHVKRMVLQDVFEAQDIPPDVVVIPNPIDAARFVPEPSTRSDAVARMNMHLGESFIGNETYNVYVIASVEERKGAVQVTDAIAQVADAVPLARFCFVGHHGGGTRQLTANRKLDPEALIARVPRRHHKRIRFAGYVNHEALPLLIQGGDVFPVMSVGDNFPGAVAEIALCGKPIVALNRAGIREMLSGAHGRCVAESIGGALRGAADRLAGRLIELASDPRRRAQIGANLRALMLRKYKPETVVDRLLNAYELALAGKRGKEVTSGSVGLLANISR